MTWSITPRSPGLYRSKITETSITVCWSPVVPLNHLNTFIRARRREAQSWQMILASIGTASSACAVVTSAWQHHPKQQVVCCCANSADSHLPASLPPLPLPLQLASCLRGVCFPPIWHFWCRNVFLSNKLPVPRRKHTASPFRKTSQPMLLSEIITFYRKNRTKRINTLNGVKYLIINMNIVLYTVYRLEFLFKYVSDTRRTFPSQSGPLEKATLDPWILHLIAVCEILRLKRLKTGRNIQKKNGQKLNSKSCLRPALCNPISQHDPTPLCSGYATLTNY